MLVGRRREWILEEAERKGSVARRPELGRRSTIANIDRLGPIFSFLRPWRLRFSPPRVRSRSRITEIRLSFR